ncbi:acyl carrier protein [Tunturibacter empetritectus]|uniref:Uncharacterized protein n=1 Tax=Tunturiibacter empetritectus TaxID=3069691 RepID=A0A7W8MQC9_9BACT|nr:hypothetical protein [Edaphobacter lichenicola]MBB5315670.1 hypothetical protein [Edaphobacter lichenicola]
MGLDAVEIVLRTEELFVITIGDDEAAAVRTVGDFYNLICSKMNVAPLQSPVTSAELPRITHKEKSSCSFPRTRRCQPRRKFCLGHPKVYGTLSSPSLSINKA